MAAVNLLWHLHQPDYRQPDSGQALMPWVRLHAVKGYSDLALALASSPSARCAVNFSGILLEQLLELADGKLDYYAELALKEPADLEPAEREFIVRNFFSANEQTMINPHPRYRELLRKRRWLVARRGLGGAAEEFDAEELRDLCAWFNLAWIGYAHARRWELSRLIARGRGFDRDELKLVLDVHREIARGVLDQYQVLAAAGIIELSVTPQHHPILPLVLDLAGEGAVDPAQPLPHFACRECARWQVATGLATFSRAFGSTPSGAWPAEGSVSDATLALLAEHGLHWAATDQQNLPPGLGHLGHLQPMRWRQDGRELTMFFRDTRLSDNIGFEYSRWNPETAARHFSEMCSELARHSGLKQPVITVALDGENPWEYFHDGGNRFLSCLFAELARHPQLTCRLPRELAAEPELPEIEHVSQGSWIGGNFDIWSRHAETRRAWQVLADAHGRLAHQGSADVDAQLLAAEASDYFWWYGDDFTCNEKPLFDHLFRSHLQEAYRIAGQAVPDELLEPLGECLPWASAPLLPAIRPPVLDGRRTTYFEWHDAQLFSNLDAGAMARQAGGWIHALWLGVAGGALALLLELDAEVLARIRASGAELAVSCNGDGDGSAVVFSLPVGEGELTGPGFAVDRVCELLIDLKAAGLAPGDTVAMKLTLSSPGARKLVYPDNGGLRFILPAVSPALNWWWV